MVESMIQTSVGAHTLNEGSKKEKPVKGIRGINVLSLFDGISCGQLALQRAGIPVEAYYASEIKKSAIKVTQKHFPQTIQLGDVTKIDFSQFRGKIDLLIGGSPCQDFSILGSRQGLEGNKSGLFFEYLRALKEVQPKWFLLENVRMAKKWQQEISKLLGVEPVAINSKLVSFQSRPRLYWTNIKGVIPPEDKGISFQDYKDTNPEYCRQFMLSKSDYHKRMWNEGKGRTENRIYQCPNSTFAEKVTCVKRTLGAPMSLIACDDFCRTLTDRELQLAQTLPENYLDGLSHSAVADLCGDGWTIDVICHIFSFLKKELLKGGE